jgi:hypothetical protein
MSSFIVLLKPIIISTCMSVIQIIDPNTKMQIALLLSELLDNKWWTMIFELFNKWNKKATVCVPDSTRFSENNPIYARMQTYMSSKFCNDIKSCELVPKNGEVDFDIKTTVGKEFTDTFNGHTLKLTVEEYTDNKKLKNRIIINSNTANSEVMRNYVRKATTCIKSNDMAHIKVYRHIMRGKTKDTVQSEWDYVMIKSTKTLDNTIYSDYIMKELFEDLDTFMNNEDWYNKRGIPYKRGYFLHSTPGQGKTSVSKILANKYKLPIFVLDLSLVSDNDTLNRLMTDINGCINNERYILLMEDAERSSFFDPYESRKITVDCLLNALDGIVEPHGRITIMTANDPTEIISNKALMRPGRLDKQLELKECDRSQLKRFYALFYNDVIDWDKIELKEGLSAAYVMKLLQENIGNSKVFLHCISNMDKAEIANLSTDELNMINSIQEESNCTNSSKKKKTGSNTDGTSESRLKTLKANLKYDEKRVTRYNNNINRAKDKIPKLMAKIQTKKEKEKIKKLKEKAKRKLAYIANKKILDEELKQFNHDDMPIEDISDLVDSDFNTPAFLLNTIPIDEIDEGTVVVI